MAETTIERREPSDEDVSAIEEAVGMGAGAWDMVDPKEIIKAAWHLFRLRWAESQASKMQ